MADKPLRRVVLLRLREATDRRRLAEEQHEKLIENAAAEGHSIGSIARAAGLSEPTIKQMLRSRARERELDDQGET